MRMDDYFIMREWVASLRHMQHKETIHSRSRIMIEGYI